MGTRTSFLLSSGASLAQKSLTSLYLSCKVRSARRNSPLPRPFFLAAVGTLDGSCSNKQSFAKRGSLDNTTALVKYADLLATAKSLQHTAGRPPRFKGSSVGYTYCRLAEQP
jgi:hypothetical protein